MTEQDLPIPDLYVNFHAKYSFAYLDGLPYRILDDFNITDAEVNPRGLEELTNCRLQGIGRVVDPNDDEKPLEQRDGIKVSFAVKEWSIEYEDPPSLWICTKNAWYKLMRPAPNYAPYYRKVLTRFKAITSIVQRLQDESAPCDAMTLDDWGDFCLDKTNGAADKALLLEEADFIVQQLLFLGEESFTNSTIYKALTEHLGGTKKPRQRTTAKRKAVENAEAQAPPKRRRLTGTQKIEQQVKAIKAQQEKEKKLRERQLAYARKKAAKEQKKQEKIRQKQLLKLKKHKDDLEFVPTIDLRNEFTPLEHDFIPDLVMVWEFLNSFKAACNFKIPNFTVTELFKAVSYTYGSEIIPVKQTPSALKRSARRGRKKGQQAQQPQDEEFVIDQANVIEDDRENFLLMIHHALIAPLLSELEEKAILGDPVETVDEEHLIAELIEQVEELDEGTTANAESQTNNNDQNPIDVDQDDSSPPNLKASNSNVNADNLKDILPKIPLTSLELNSITWIEVIRLYLLKRSELFASDEIVELLSLQEYFTLPLEAKLKILAFLCDEFMTTRTFRVVMDKNMSRKTVLAIQLRDLKREVRTLQQEYRKQLEAKNQLSYLTPKPMIFAPVIEDDATRKERMKFEKAEASLQKEIASLSADLKDAGRTLRLSPIGQDRMFDKYWMFPPNEHKNMLFVELTPEHEFQSLRQNSMIDDQVIDMNIGEESIFSENNNGDKSVAEKSENGDEEHSDNRPLLKRYLFTGKSSWHVCNKELQLNKLTSLLDNKSEREKKLAKALEPVQEEILTRERLEPPPENPQEKPKINVKTTSLRDDNIMTSYYLEVDKTEREPKKKHSNVSVNMKVVSKLRADLLDLEDCIPFESIIIQTVDWDDWRNKVATNNDPAILIDAITVLEQATNPKSFKSAWLKRERRLFKELTKHARTTAQLGVLLDLMRRNIKSTEDYTQTCTICKNDEKDEVDNILLCDKCDKGFHLSCLTPPLTAVPSGFWFCNSCKDKLEESRKNKGQREVNSYFCAKCHDGGDLLCCETCPRVYHITCLDPPLDAVPEDDWFCPTCTEKRQKEAVKTPQPQDSTEPNGASDTMQVEEVPLVNGAAEVNGVHMTQTNTDKPINPENSIFSEAIDAIKGSNAEDLMVDVVSLDNTAPQLLSPTPQANTDATDETIIQLQQTSLAILKAREDNLLEQALQNIDDVVARVVNGESLQFPTEMMAIGMSEVNGVEKRADEVTDLVAKEQ